jgi:hypothetical protein
VLLIHLYCALLSFRIKVDFGDDGVGTRTRVSVFEGCTIGHSGISRNFFSGGGGGG